MVEIGKGRKNRKNISIGKKKSGGRQNSDYYNDSFFSFGLSIFGMHSFDYGGFLPYKNLLIFIICTASSIPPTRQDAGQKAIICRSYIVLCPGH
jgi:hypothetical protein